MAQVGFFIKRPQAGRKSFAVIGFTVENGKRSYYTVKDERVTAVNRAVKLGALSAEDAARQCQEVVDDLYRKQGSQSQAIRRSGLLKDNERVFDKFWEEVYGGREIVDRVSMKADYIRALKVLGTTSIISASKTELAKAIRKNVSNTAQHRRVANRLNTILKFLGRDVTIEKPEEEVKVIRHLTLPELRLLLSTEEDKDYRALYATLFSTGMRIGEAMAMSLDHFHGESVFVGSQITVSGKRKLPKRGKTGHVLFLPEFEGEVKAWCGIAGKTAFRQNLNRRLKGLYRKTWPKDKAKCISVHSFRHSHAIHYLSLGVPLEFIARNLRNRIEVCQKYYAGYAHSSSTMSAMRSFLLQASKKW